jgi:hypothetical protein
MKKEKYEQSKVYVDVSEDEIVKDYFDSEFIVSDFDEDYLEYLNSDYFLHEDYFWEDYQLTDEEKKKVVEKIIERSKEEFEKIKKEQRNVFKDRESILAFINDFRHEFYDTSICESFDLLDDEEILDLIIENGKK